MPKRVFAVSQPGDLVIAWRGIWKDVTVTHAGNVVGGFANQKELKEGRDFTLADGSSLRVKLTTGFGNVQLEVSHDGTPVRGSDGDPAVQLKAAAGVTYFIGGLTCLISAIAMATRVDILVAMGMGPLTLAAGVFYLGLGFGVSKRSRLALGIAIVLFILDGVLSLATYMSYAKGNGTPPVGPVVMRVILLIPMFRGFAAISALERAEPPSARVV
jgi:hypothetical protein